MLRGLDKSAEYVKSGDEPDLAIAKVAKESDLTPSETIRLVETFNKANTVAFMKTASSEDRSKDYTLATNPGVMKFLHNDIPKEASENILKSSYDYYVKEPMTKVASSVEPMIRRHQLTIAPESINKKASLLRDTYKKNVAIAREEIAKRKWSIDKNLRKMASMCIATRVPKELKKMASDIVNSCGSEGNTVINAANAFNEDPNKYLPNTLEKRAFAISKPHPIVKIAQEILINRSGLVPLDNLLKQAKHDDYKANELYKQAGAYEDDPHGEDPGFGSSMTGLLKEIGEPKNVSNWKMDSSDTLGSMDPSTGMVGGQWDAILKSIRNKDKFMRLYVDDEELNNYPLEKVQRTYNDIVGLMPQLATKNIWMRAALRKAMAQGGQLDAFELKDMLSTAESLTKKDKYTAETNASLVDDDKKKTKDQGIQLPSINLPAINIGGV